jgi:excisionase family DNA binding protein
MLLSIEQVAERLRCSDDQVRVLIRAGELPYVNIGGGTQRRCIRVQADALEEFIRRRTSSVKPTPRQSRPKPSRQWV